MKKIIVPVDFSTTAENAAVFATNLAAFYKADVCFLYVFEVVAPLAEYGYNPVSPLEMQEASMFELEKFAAKVKQQVNTPVNINLKAMAGVLQDSLDTLCSEVQPDLVVMGLSGKNALTKLVVGSNTIRAIHQLKYPVLVVPARANFIPIRKIGFACDYTKVIETTPVAPIKKLVADFNAELYVLNVDSNLTGVPTQQEAEGMYINELLKDVKPYYSTIYAQDVTTGVNWFAEKEKIDWLVMIPKKHNLLDKIFGRSHTKDLLYHTHIPVLCMHE
jgi:nucleotide-binding universal stress UspA family protein